MKISALALILALLFIVACGEDDSPADRDYKGGFKPNDLLESELVETTLGFVLNNGLNPSSVSNHKIINHKSGDRYYFVEYSIENSTKYAIAVQFSGTYDDKERSLDNITIISCENTGVCTECLLSAPGNCAVLSCSCTQSGEGSYDCDMNYRNIRRFRESYASSGKEAAAKINIPELIQVNCETF
ncbi:MAG: hypothetical protein WCZ17_02855 [Candidatus Kapaibacterium sp.]|jgi:hypothetical protein|nr:hypothetical protein [Candidatus Kapabacteria bacterium]